MTLSPKARELLARAATKAKEAPKAPWNVRSGSGVKIAEVRLCYAPRKGGVAWIIKHRRNFVAEFTGPDAKAKALSAAQALRTAAN